MSTHNLTIPITITKSSVEDLVHGTGVLGWVSWWGGFEVHETSLTITHDTEDGDEGAFQGETTVNFLQIADAISKALESGNITTSIADIQESIGLLDAEETDCVLQYAIFGRLIFG